MAQYRKKPVVIEAVQWNGNGPVPGVCEGGCVGFGYEKGTAPHIHTLENENGHTVSLGDWIVTGIQGERYAVKPDIFAATYDPV